MGLKLVSQTEYLHQGSPLFCPYPWGLGADKGSLQTRSAKFSVSWIGQLPGNDYDRMVTIKSLLQT